MHRIAASPNATATVPLLAAARQKGIPVVYTRVVYHHSGADDELFVQKVPALRRIIEGEPLADILPELPPAGRHCSHQAMFDINPKCGDVVALQDVMHELAAYPVRGA
jgi:nicotinamidase-related amidase